MQASLVLITNAHLYFSTLLLKRGLGLRECPTRAFSLKPGLHSLPRLSRERDDFPLMEGNLSLAERGFYINYCSSAQILAYKVRAARM